MGRCRNCWEFSFWGKALGIRLSPTRVKNSHYLLVPGDLAQLVGIDNKNVLLMLTIEDGEEGQRLV